MADYASLSVGPFAPQRESRLALLAPNFAAALALLLVECHQVGLRVHVFETLRTAERQKWLYAQGRTRDLGSPVVTNAQTNLTSWHGFGLGVDLAFKDDRGNWYWPSDAAPWHQIAKLAEKFLLLSGAGWKIRDYSHLQPANLKVSPSDTARNLFAAGGFRAVWTETGHDSIKIFDHPGILP